LFSGVTAVALAADQASKVWARGNLRVGEPVAVIDGFFDWSLSVNHGSAFSMFEGWSGAYVLLSAVALGALAAILWMVRSTGPARRLRITALGLIAGGALGNLIDRMALGGVTDFILWHAGDVYWPIFNLADVFLLVGVGAMVCDEALASRRSTVRSPTPEQAS
jgi:signal peptidase II